MDKRIIILPLTPFNGDTVELRAALLALRGGALPGHSYGVSRRYVMRPFAAGRQQP